MNIFVIKTERKNLVDALIECDSDDEVINLLSGIRQRGVMVGIIIELLNKLSEEHQENINLKNKLLKIRKEEGIEIL